MSYKLYADDQCVAEIAENPSEKIQKKPCNCPNCGAPITSYICEYCGTELEKPKKVLTDEEKRESFADFVREQKLAQMKAYQSQINISPYQGPKEEKKSKSADEELVEALMLFMIGMVLFTLFAIVVTFIYNLH